MAGRSHALILMLPALLLAQLLLVLQGPGAHAFSVPIKAVLKAKLPIITKKFAKLPAYNGKPSKIVAMTPFGPDLYVATSVSGGIIYKVSSTGKVTAWFNVAKAMKAKKRVLNLSNFIHGGVRCVAFHTSFKTNRLVYVSVLEDWKVKLPASRYFSRPATPVKTDSVVLEFKTSKAGVPIAASLREVIRISFPSFDHTINHITFNGPLLYISHGDGSAEAAKKKGGQGNDGLGKILRINPVKAGAKPYSIPASNPFAKSPKFKGEIYAYGFHNPHHMCFSKRGELFVADTGRDNFEEVNIVKAGKNYGWPAREGHYVHNAAGGVGINIGVSPLPKNDATFKYVYPNAVLPHFGKRGAKVIGQSIAGGCPIENGSKLNGLYLYANFPTNGAVYYSTIADLRKAKTSGPPASLKDARTFRAKVLYDHDGKPKTAPIGMATLRDVVIRDMKKPNLERVDMRFGAGKRGEMYWSSKSNGQIYVITNSVP